MGTWRRPRGAERRGELRSNHSSFFCSQRGPLSSPRLFSPRPKDIGPRPKTARMIRDIMYRDFAYSDFAGFYASVPLKWKRAVSKGLRTSKSKAPLYCVELFLCCSLRTAQVPSPERIV